MTIELVPHSPLPEFPKEQNGYDEKKIELEEIQPTDVSEVTATLDGDALGKPTMQLIQELVEKYNYSMDDIKKVDVHGVKRLNEKGTPEEATFQTRDGQERKTTYNEVSEWEHSKTGVKYAQLPMEYEIKLAHGGKELSIKFQQPRYTNVKMPVPGTPHDQERLQRKMMALLGGVREEIRSAVASKDEKKITALANKTISSFEFAYGKSGYLHDKKLLPFQEKGARLAGEDDATVIGVYKRADTAGGRICSRFGFPILAEEFGVEDVVGRKHVGLIKNPVFEKFEKARGDIEQVCSERYDKGIGKDDSVNTVLKSHTSEIQNEELFVQVEARSAVEKLGDTKVLLDQAESEKGLLFQLSRSGNMAKRKLEVISEKMKTIPCDLFGNKKEACDQEFVEKVEKRYQTVEKQIADHDTKLQKKEKEVLECQDDAKKAELQKELDALQGEKVQMRLSFAEVTEVKKAVEERRKLIDTYAKNPGAAFPPLSNELLGREYTAEQSKLRGVFNEIGTLQEELAALQAPIDEKRRTELTKEIADKQVEQKTLEVSLQQRENLLKINQEGVAAIHHHEVVEYTKLRKRLLDQSDLCVRNIQEVDSHLKTVHVLTSSGEVDEKTDQHLENLKKARDAAGYDGIKKKIKAFRKAVMDASVFSDLGLQIESVEPELVFSDSIPHPQSKVRKHGVTVQEVEDDDSAPQVIKSSPLIEEVE